MKKLELPSGDYTSVVTAENYGRFHLGLGEALADITKALLEIHCERRDLPLAESVSHMGFAMIAFTAFSMQAAATGNGSEEFDPVAFGKRCEEIAREQIQRYETRFEQAGTA